MRRGVAGVRLCHASPCKYPAGKCPLHDLPRVGESIDWSKASHPPIFVGNCCDDMNACLCGYAVCSCHVIDAEFAEAEPGPPKDVLPEGWMLAAHGVCWHVSGAEVRPSIDLDCWFWWRAPIIGSPSCADPKPTRELAMAAALQSVEPKPVPRVVPVCAVCGGKQKANGEWCTPSDPEWDHAFEPIKVGKCIHCGLLESGHGYHSGDGGGCPGGQYKAKPAEPALRPGWQWNEGDKRWDHKGIDATVYQSMRGTWVAIKWGGRAEPGHPTLEAAMIRAEALARGEP